MRINLDVNEDVERVLGKVANKRKTSMNILINEILEAWLDDKDNHDYEKTSNQKKKNLKDYDHLK